MTAIPIDEDTATCPGCWRPTPVEHLCTCDADNGPMCASCCEREHREWWAT